MRFNELEQNRQLAKFEPRCITLALYGGEKKLRRREKLAALILAHPEFRDPKPLAFMTRSERMENASRKIIALQQLIETNDEIDIDINPAAFGEMGYLQGLVFGTDSHALSLHFIMFLPTIQNQMDDEQLEEWLPKVIQRSIIGTYAQTELGHGTNLAALETTATYDTKTEQFILNSPTITSIKWWPGQLGKSSNYAIVMAQLWTKGQCYGPHAFIVQLRNEDTHLPMPGIEVGDIGPKWGFASNDNGYLRLNNVRIPRRHMLMRNAKVLRNGDYIHPPHKKLSFGTMIFVRSFMNIEMASCLAIASVIATRYSCTRRQGLIESNKPEVPLIDYQSQQFRLFPAIATAYAYYLIGQRTLKIYLESSEQLQAGNLDFLPELHALTSGIKSVVSWDCAQAIEQCRMACGGHGFAQYSGIPEIYVHTVAGCTYEGDNIVMLLQVARFLCKTVRAIQLGTRQNRSVITNYLTEKLSPGHRSSLNSELRDVDLIDAFEHAARQLAFKAVDSLNNSEQIMQSAERAWVDNQIILTKAARAHTYTYLVRTVVDAVDAMQLTDEEARIAMRSLCKLFIVNIMLRHRGNFLDGYVTNQQMDIVENARVRMLKEIRPNAIALTDAWQFSDEQLRSCLGRYDGNVYEAIVDWAKKSELNETEVIEAHTKYNGPFMKGQRARL